MRLFEFFQEPENPLMGTPRDTVYSRGKGAHKQKSERYRPAKMRFQKCSVRHNLAVKRQSGIAAPFRRFSRIIKNKKTGRIFEISVTYSGIFGNIVKK